MARVRDRAESAIVAYLAGPEAQQRHNPRSWRTHHGDSDFKRAFDLAIGLSTSGEAAHAYLDWLTVVARDEIEAQWPQVEKVAQALKRYGMILADNGSPWYISGAPNRRWNNDALHLLGQLSGRDFEVVDTTSLPHPGL